MHAPHKKLRLPEWYVLAWMMERALNAVVRDGKTIYIVAYAAIFPVPDPN